MAKKKTVRQLKKQLDQTFSKWIRRRDKFCITCGSTQNLQAGHYFSRSYTNVRYNEYNVNAQCCGCNVFKKGNIAVYRIKLFKKYGNQVVDWLDRNYNLEKRFTTQELLDLIQKYAT